jgi:AraC family transcriptional regulator
MGTGDCYLRQEDGCPPAVLAGGSAPGESGVSVISLRFLQGLHFRGTPDQHLIWFQSPMLNVECRMADRILCHDAPAGSLAICPAGLDCAADAGQSVDTVIVSVDPARLALAATEDFAPDAKLMERLCGYDEQLLDMARTLVAESADDYREGPLFWGEVAGNFVEGLVARHISRPSCRGRGTFSKDVLKRLRDYVMTHLDEPIDVSTLAGIAGRSPPFFSRVHPLGRHDPAPLRGAPASAARDGACPRGAVELRPDRGADRLCRSKSLVALGPARARRHPLRAHGLRRRVASGAAIRAPRRAGAVGDRRLAQRNPC